MIIQVVQICYPTEYISYIMVASGKTIHGFP